MPLDYLHWITFYLHHFGGKTNNFPRSLLIGRPLCPSCPLCDVSMPGGLPSVCLSVPAVQVQEVLHSKCRQADTRQRSGPMAAALRRVPVGVAEMLTTPRAERPEDAACYRVLLNLLWQERRQVTAHQRGTEIESQKGCAPAFRNQRWFKSQVRWA